MSRATGVPVVFDALHHRVYQRIVRQPDDDASYVTDVLREVFATWGPLRDGPPKMHYSTQAVGLRPGAHAAEVDSAEFATFLAQTPREATFDIMLEAKAKEQAVFSLRATLGSTLTT